MNINASFSIARFACLEMWRGKVAWLLFGVLIVAVSIAEFAASIAITDVAEYRVAFYCASARFACVFVVAMIVAINARREFSDQTIQLSLARPLSRIDWYLGKLFAACVLCATFAGASGALLSLYSPLGALLWGYSLFLELLLIAAASLAFTVSLRQLPLALGSVSLFYLLSRCIGAIALMSTGPAVDSTLTSSRFIASAVGLLAALLPDLGRFTRSAWLIESLPGAAAFGFLTLQTGAFLGVLIALGLFDLYRRNL